MNLKVNPLVLSLILICVGTVAGLVFLTDFFHKPPAPPSTELEAQKQNILQLQAQLAALEQSSVNAPKAGTTADTAYLQGLKQHEALLAEVRAELQFANAQATAATAALNEAKETERRTREAATTFLGVFAIIAALLAGQGYLTIQGWKDKAEADITTAVKAVEAKKVDLDTIQSDFRKGVDQDVQRLKDAAPQLDLIRETQKGLETNLPIFLDRVRGQVLLNESKDPSASIKQGDLVLIDEIDHLTYLANPPVRFKLQRTPAEATEYLQSLLLVGRGHFVRGNYDEAISRFNEFMAVKNDNPQVIVKGEDEGRAYSYRAFARYHLLRARRKAPSWTREANLDTANKMWSEAMADALQAKTTDPPNSLFVQALLYSREYVPDSLIPTPAGQSRYLEGQQKAIEFYEEMLRQNLSYWPVPINLVCCCKRIADTTGHPSDYVKLESKLSSFPGDAALDVSAKAGSGIPSESRFLWQNMLADETLFGKVIRIDAVHYKKFWTELLEQKVTLRNWRVDLEEIRRMNPSAKGWQIQLQ